MKRAMNQSKLILILNGISILALIFMVVLLFISSSVNRKLNIANEDRFNLTYNANRFMNGSAYLTNEVRAYASTGNQEHYDNYWNEINNLKNRDIGVAAMQEIGITSSEQSMIDQMSSISNNLVPLEEQAMKNVQGGQMAEALDYVYGTDYNTSIAEINSLKEQFLSALDMRTKAEVNSLSLRSTVIQVLIVISLFLVAVLQLLINMVTKKRILNPVIAVKDQMSEISQGNLSANFFLESDTSEIGMLVESIHETKRELKKYIQDIDSKLAMMADGKMDLSIDLNYRGEFLPIQKAMSQILDALNAALSKINQTASEVSEEAEKMANDAQVLSHGAVEQAAAVEELSSSIQSLSSQVNLTSEDAKNARKSSTDAASQLTACNQKMRDLTQAMEDISQSSRQISGIIKIIEDISFQTNILALNAAVEAARAGSAGKGFAVVADEVQSLATKSSVAAQDITKLIESSLRLVEHGTALSNDTTQSLATGVTGAQQSTVLIERIAESALQQAEMLRQLTEGMEQISDVVQTNASTAEKSAASAQELHSQAQELKESVQKFQLRR
ncbi:MAG: methyl-accepting chemotaxis protein [Lachnospiraceae bacterium]|nr:methyl-accepting chemotaxis protein [Lachnospiraceae bacterium]